MKVNNAGTWVEPKTIWVNNGGTWTKPKSIWVNNNGTWVRQYQSIPSNMVVLYDSTTYPGYICNGSNGTPNLLSRFIYASATALITGGTYEHSGESHGSTAGTYSAANNILDAGSTGLFPAGYATTSSTHTHTSSANHAHSYTQANGLLFYRYNLVPTMGADYITTNALFFNRAALSNAQWTAFASYAGYYLFFHSSNSARAGTTHAHSTAYSAESNNTAVTATKNYYNNPDTATWHNSHKHGGVNHILSTASTLVLPYYRYYSYYYNSSTPLYNIANLPINTVALFSSTTLPDGWVRISDSDEKYIQFGNNTGLSSSTTNTASSHTHGGSEFSSEGVNPSASLTADNTGNTSAYTIKAHTHTFNDSHPTAVDVTPPWVSLIVAYKNY